MSNLILQVEILEDGVVVETLELADKKVKVGNLSTSQLRLDDPKISRMHAVLENQYDGTFLAIDMGSATGTFVNGKKVTKATVRDGDELRFGDTTVRIFVVDPAVLAAEEQAVAASAVVEVPEGHLQLEDGSVVEPFTMEGYYDDGGNYIPGYYDEEGVYHYGYGFHNDEGQWQVAHGFYDPDGEWVPTEAPEGERPSDREVYTENFFHGNPGNILEIAFLWSDHVIDVESYKKPRSVTIGGSEDNDYVLENHLLGVPQFPLVTYDEGGGYRLNFMPQMEGLIQRDGEQFSLDEAVERGLATASPDTHGAYNLPLLRGTSVRLDLGANTFLIHFTQLPALAGSKYGVERAPIFYQAVSLGLHLAFMLLVFTLPDNFGGLELHDFNANDRFVELLTPPEQEEEEIPEWLDGAEETAAHAEDEGETGDEREEETDNQLAIEGDVDPEDVELAKARDTEIAMDAGALAVFNEMGSPLSDAANSLGADAMHALGNLEGENQGAAAGVGGLGLAGAGRGGGGVSERGLGRAQMGGGGLGGAGDGSGEGVGLGDREVLEPQLILQDPNVTGSLDREIIQRVVRQHRREMSHCYEQELQRNPNLAGRIVMTWVISPNGSVVSSSVSETTMNNAAVENCMAQRIRRWVFPEPDGGGIVRVNYPFNFST